MKRTVAKEGIYYVGMSSHIDRKIQKEVIMRIPVKGKLTTFPMSLDDDYNNLKTYDGVGTRIFAQDFLEITRIFAQGGGEAHEFQSFLRKIDQIRPQFTPPYDNEINSTWKPKPGSGCLFYLKAGDEIRVEGNTIYFPNSKINI